MAIYIGGTKCKLRINGVACNLNIPTSIPITNGIRLLSSDGFTLKDANNLYMTATEYVQVSSLDNCVLQDINNLYLTTRKG